MPKIIAPIKIIMCDLDRILHLCQQISASATEIIIITMTISAKSHSWLALPLPLPPTIHCHYDARIMMDNYRKSDAD